MNYQHSDEESRRNDYCDEYDKTSVPSDEIEEMPLTTQVNSEPKQKKSYKAFLIPGIIMLLFLLLIIRWDTSSSRTRVAALLTQYAESKEWLADCTIQKAALESIYTDRVHYYLYDFADDARPELVITAADGEKNVDCMVYGVSGNRVELWGILTYYTDDPEVQIENAEVTIRNNYSGLALRLTLHDRGEDAFVAFLQLSERNGIEEQETIRGLDECEERLQNDGWQLLTGTPITLPDTALVNNFDPEELAALAVLYTPDGPVYSYYDHFVAADETVYSLETTGLYRFSDGEKSILSSAPTDTHYSPSSGLIYNKKNIYFISLLPTEKDAIMCVDTETGAETVLFELPNAEELLKVDERYVYVQISYADEKQLGEIRVYDHQGNMAKTLKVPCKWDTCGTMVLVEDWKGNISAATKDGEYLLNNVPVENAVLTEKGVYYLTTENEETTLFFADRSGQIQMIGWAPAGSGAYFERLAGTMCVNIKYGEEGEEAFFLLPDMQCVYSGQLLQDALPDSGMYSFASVDLDVVTGKTYIVPTYAPHGNCGSIYRLSSDGELEKVRDATEDEMYYEMVYDNVLYYYYKDYSETFFYFSSPNVTACKPLAPSGNTALRSMTERAFGFWKGEKTGALYCFVGDEVMCLREEPWSSDESEFRNNSTFFTIEEDEGRLLFSFERQPDETACIATFSGDSIELKGIITDTLLPLPMAEGLDIGAVRIEEQEEAWSGLWQNMDMLDSAGAIAQHWKLMVQAEITYMAEALDADGREELYDEFEAWQEEVAAAADEAASEFEGGSGEPVAYSIAYKELYAEKYVQLRGKIR